MKDIKHLYIMKKIKSFLHPYLMILLIVLISYFISRFYPFLLAFTFSQTFNFEINPNVILLFSKLLVFGGASIDLPTTNDNFVKAYASFILFDEKFVEKNCHIFGMPPVCLKLLNLLYLNFGLFYIDKVLAHMIITDQEIPDNIKEAAKLTFSSFQASFLRSALEMEIKFFLLLCTIFLFIYLIWYIKRNLKK